MASVGWLDRLGPEDVVDEPSLIEELRSRATDLARARRWAEVLDLRPLLERDTEYWTPIWGPVCAVAAYHERRADARELLVSVIDAGFHDLDPVADVFADSFATEPDWPPCGRGWRPTGRHHRSR